MFNLLQDDQESTGVLSTSRSALDDLRVGRFGVLDEIGGQVSNSFREEEKGERGGDEGENQSDDDKGGKELLVNDTGGKTDVEDDNLNQTIRSVRRDQ